MVGGAWPREGRPRPRFARPAAIRSAVRFGRLWGTRRVGRLGSAPLVRTPSRGRHDVSCGLAGAAAPRRRAYGAVMATIGGVEDSPDSGAVADDVVESLIPIVRRIIRARVSDPVVAEDLVQETLVNVLAKANRVAPPMLEPYAIVTARNVVKSMWIERDRQRRNQHRVLEGVDAEAVSAALTRLSERERATLLAHEVAGQGTRSLAEDLGLSAGAVA